MKYKTAVLASIVGKRLLVEDFNELKEALSELTGTLCYTHASPEMADSVKPIILEKYPDLALVDSYDINKDNWQQKVQELNEKFGEYLEV